MDDTLFLGALPDTRPESEKQKDVQQAEVVATAAAPIWKEKKEKDIRSFPDQEQDGSGSCVAQTIKKSALILFWLKTQRFLDFSAVSIYFNRSNKPGSGMIGVEAFEIWRKLGISLEALVPSQNMNDGQMDAAKMTPEAIELAKAFSVANHVGLPNMDIEAVASTIEATGKPVMVWYWFTSREWSRQTPEVLDTFAFNDERMLKHSVTAVDYFLKDGKKCLRIEDSAHFGGLTKRDITEDFHSKRNWFTRYPATFKFDTTSPPQVTFKFARTMEFIPLDEAKNQPADMGKHEAQKADVIRLQDFLKAKGFFPTNQTSTGYYGSLTAKGVYAAQVAYEVAPLSELNSIVPRGGRVGEKTIIGFNARI